VSHSHLDPSLVDVALDTSRRLVHEFQGRKTRGTEHTFVVADRNFVTRNTWEFVVFVPDAWRKGTYASVQPRAVPNRRVWAGLERRSIQFAPCTRPGYRSRCYGMLAVSDPTGERNREYLNKGDARPPWLRGFRVRTKGTVTTSRALDENRLVAVFDPQDWSGMIRLFLAMKPWVLEQRYSRHDAAAARRLSRRRILQARRSLRGLSVAVTGHLGLGTRSKVEAWLRNHGVTVCHRPSSENCAILIEGFHYKGANRLKIRLAKKHGVLRLSEAEFHRRYRL
jgi:hypothetical protein